MNNNKKKIIEIEKHIIYSFSSGTMFGACTI